MDYELYRKIEPAITIYSGNGSPNPAFAPYEALLALPNMTNDYAQQIIAARQSMVPGQAPAQPLLLPDGTPIVANGGGVTYSVKSRAQLPNGVSTVLDASIRIGGVGTSGRAALARRRNFVIVPCVHIAKIQRGIFRRERFRVISIVVECAKRPGR
jgi:general secretion pathway protein K